MLDDNQVVAGHSEAREALGMSMDVAANGATAIPMEICALPAAPDKDTSPSR